MNKFNFSGVEGVQTTDRRVADVEASGTETDGSYRLVKRGLFATSEPGVFEVYKAGDAHSVASSVLYSRDQVVERFSVYEVGSRYPHPDFRS